MVYITRKEHFNAAHKLHRPEWSKEKNLEVFGPCSNENWHGHNYDIFVTLKGEIDPITGFVLDLRILSKLLREKVIDIVDHKNLNIDVPFMKDKMTSTEVLVVEIWNQMAEEIKSNSDNRAELHCIKLCETERNFVEYYG